MEHWNLCLASFVLTRCIAVEASLMLLLPLMTSIISSVRINSILSDKVMVRYMPGFSVNEVRNTEAGEISRKSLFSGELSLVFRQPYHVMGEPGLPVSSRVRCPLRPHVVLLHIGRKRIG